MRGALAVALPGLLAIVLRCLAVALGCLPVALRGLLPIALGSGWLPIALGRGALPVTLGCAGGVRSRRRRGGIARRRRLRIARRCRLRIVRRGRTAGIARAGRGLCGSRGCRSRRLRISRRRRRAGISSRSGTNALSALDPLSSLKLAGSIKKLPGRINLPASHRGHIPTGVIGIRPRRLSALTGLAQNHHDQRQQRQQHHNAYPQSGIQGSGVRAILTLRASSRRTLRRGSSL